MEGWDEVHRGLLEGVFVCLVCVWVSTILSHDTVTIPLINLVILQASGLACL